MCFNFLLIWPGKNIMQKSYPFFIAVWSLMLIIFYSENIKSENSDSLMGVYEYVYEYNSEDLIENHYIEIKEKNKNISGVYYGTSDDFDEAREGYLPGFFKAEMKNIKITAKNIIFEIYVSNADMYKKPITPLKKEKENPLWGVGGKKSKRIYSGDISAGIIMIKTKGFDPRKFKKVSANKK